MNKERIIHFLKILTEDESLKRSFSPFKYGISFKYANFILQAFSIKIINPHLNIYKYFSGRAKFFKIQTKYVINNDFNNIYIYNLTLEIIKKTNLSAGKLHLYLKEYFYLKLIFHILFKCENLRTNELIEIIKN